MWHLLGSVPNKHTRFVSQGISAALQYFIIMLFVTFNLRQIIAASWDFDTAQSHETVDWFCSPICISVTIKTNLLIANNSDF